MTDMRETRNRHRTRRARPPPLELTFSTEAAPWRGDLGAFLRDRLPPALHVRPGAGAGIGASSLHSGEAAARASAGDQGRAVFPGRAADVVARGRGHWNGAHRAGGGCARALELDPARTSQPRRLEHLIHVEDGHLVLSNCQLTAPAVARTLAGDLIAFRSASTQPRPLDLDRAAVLVSDRSPGLPAGRLRSDHGRPRAPGRAGAGAGRTFAVRGGRRRDGDRAEARERRQAPVRGRPGARPLHADLGTNDRSRGLWPGLRAGAGPPLADHFAELRLSEPERPDGPRDGVARDATATRWRTARVFWQADDDAAEVDWFISVGDAPPPANRSRDVQQQWVQFWGRNHMGRVTGPRGSGSQPSVRFRDRGARPGDRAGRLDPRPVVSPRSAGVIGRSRPFPAGHGSPRRPRPREAERAVPF